MDTITVTNHADIEFIVVVNTDFWNGLPQKHRDLIQAAAVKAENSVRDEMSSIEARAYEASKEHGMTVYTPTDAEMAEWRSVSQPVYDDVLAKTGAMGKAMRDAAQSF